MEAQPEGLIATQLREIVKRGGRAQAAEAARLLPEILADPEARLTRDRAGALVQAYLHDPDLTR